MLHLRIPDMSCGHCEITVKQTVQTLDPAATVSVDLSTHQAEIETTASQAALLSALHDAGYPATPL